MLDGVVWQVSYQRLRDLNAGYQVCVAAERAVPALRALFPLSARSSSLASLPITVPIQQDTALYYISGIAPGNGSRYLDTRRPMRSGPVMLWERGE
jgi:hypothetical protein